MSEHRKRLIGDKGEIKSAKTAEESALAISHALLTGENDGDQPFARKFPKATGDGHDVMMPAVIRQDRGGKDQEFPEGEIRLAGIAGVTPDGQLLCYFEDKDGEVLEDSAGKDEQGDARLKLAYTREEVLGLQMQAELNTYAKLFVGEDSQQVFQACMGNRDMDESLDPAIENAAKNRIPTADDIRSLISSISPDETTRSPQATKLLENLDGKVVLTKDDFQEAVTVLGGSKEAFAQQSDKLSAEIANLEATLKIDNNNATAQQRLEAAQAEQAVLGNAYKLFSEAEAKGETPFDGLFDQIQNGEFDSEAAQALLESVRKGDLSGIVDKMLEEQTKGMDAEERARWKTNTLKALKGSAIVGGAPLGLAALLAALAGALVIGAAMSIKPGH